MSANRGLNILYVDEPDATADKVARLLERLDFSTLVVNREHSLSAARNAIAACSPDIVIADFWLNDGTSVILADEIVRRKGVPVVLLSSLEATEINDICGDTGSLIVHSKANLSAAALQRTICSALDAAA